MCVKYASGEETITTDELIGQMMGFMAKYVSKLYGARYMSGWMRKNKDRKFIDLFTMSDVAYCLALVENYHEVWEEEIDVRKEIEKLPAKECVSFQKRN